VISQDSCKIDTIARKISRKFLSMIDVVHDSTSFVITSVLEYEHTGFKTLQLSNENIKADNDITAFSVRTEVRCEPH